MSTKSEAKAARKAALQAEAVRKEQEKVHDVRTTGRYAADVLGRKTPARSIRGTTLAAMMLAMIPPTGGGPKR